MSIVKKTIFFCLLISFLWAQPLKALDITVSNATELYGAIEQANASSGTHIIRLMPGDYILSAGDLDVMATVTIQGENSRTTALIGGGNDRVLHVRPGAQATLNDLTIRGGRTDTEFGAGIFVEASQLNLDRCWLTDNVNNSDSGGEGTGAAIANLNGSLFIENSLISYNHADEGRGGAIFNREGDYIIRNSTISHNTAKQGAGIFNDNAVAAPGPVRIENSAIVFNGPTDGGGGGMFGGGAEKVTLYNTIIALNLAMVANGSPDCRGTFVSEGFNIVGDRGLDIIDCDLGDNPSDQIGTKTNPIDPLLGPLEDNGGPTDTHALLIGSPAIDRGDTANCPAMDQRGALRPFNGECDIGPFEVTDCGNGILDVGEVCDDGNLTNGDGCESTCQFTIDANASSNTGGGCSLQKAKRPEVQPWVYLLMGLGSIAAWRFKGKKQFL